MYQKRRYRYVDGKLEKRWDGFDGDGWCETKEQALDLATAPEPPRRGRKPGSKNKAKAEA